MRWKRILFRICMAVLFLLGLLIAGGLTVQHFTTRVPFYYYINKVNVEKIAFCDSLIGNYDMYQLSFETSPAGFEYGLFKGGIEPYIQGCADSLIEISFMTEVQSARVPLTSLWINKHKVEALTLQECEGSDTLSGDFYDNITDLKTFMQKGRHYHENYCHDGRILNDEKVYIAMPKQICIPRYIILKFKEKCIIGEIHQQTLKQYFLKSIMTTQDDCQVQLINLR